MQSLSDVAIVVCYSKASCAVLPLAIISSRKEKVITLPLPWPFMEEGKKDPGIWSKKRRERESGQRTRWKYQEHVPETAPVS